MVGEKMTNALLAVDRFLTKLLSPEDEIFLYKFSNFPELVQDWTTDRQRLSRAIRRINAERRHRDVRRDRRIGAAGADRPASQARDRADFRRQRHRQPGVAERSETDDPRVGSDGVRDRHRRSGRRCLRLPAVDARADAAAADAESVSRRAAPARPGRRHPSAASAVPVAVPAGTGPHDGAPRRRRSRQPATRCARSPTTAAAARKSCARAAISIRPRRTSPTS